MKKKYLMGGGYFNPFIIRELLGRKRAEPREWR